ncbi:MAG: acetate--CoA ligase family protein [Candidatus Geothermarchaeales archaeon]
MDTVSPRNPFLTVRRRLHELSVAAKIIEAAVDEGRSVLTEVESKNLLSSYGIPVPPSVLVTGPQEADEASDQIGFPLAVKIVSPDILHKTEVGGVIVDVSTREDLREAYSTVVMRVKREKPNAEIRGVLVEKMARPGVEVAVGCSTDPQFGHVVMFGLGGIYVELLQDVTFRIVPLTPIDAQEMFDEIGGKAVLDGFRGMKPRDKNALAEILMSVSRLLEEGPRIDQLDLNPIVSYSRGALVVDAKTVLRR